MRAARDRGNIISRSEQIYLDLRNQALRQIGQKHSLIWSVAGIQTDFEVGHQIARDVIAALYLDGYSVREGSGYHSRSWSQAEALEGVRWVIAIARQSIMSWSGDERGRMASRLAVSEWDWSNAVDPFTETSFLQVLDWHTVLLSPAGQRGMVEILARVLQPAFFRMLWETCYFAFPEMSRSIIRFSGSLSSSDRSEMVSGIEAVWNVIGELLNSPAWPHSNNPLDQRHEILEANIAGRILPFGRKVKDQVAMFPSLDSGIVQERPIQT